MKKGKKKEKVVGSVRANRLQENVLLGKKLFEMQLQLDELKMIN
jgi:hypothetical protein